MGRISGLVIGVTVDIIRQETNALHIRKQLHSEGKQLAFDGKKEVMCSLNVAFCEAFHHIPAQRNMVNVGVILSGCVGSCAKKVAIVRENETRHDRVKVDDTQHSARFIKEHVVHFRVAMADTFGQSALTIEHFGTAHGLGMGLQKVDQRANFGQSAGHVGQNGLAKLAYSQLHIMEVGYGLAQSLVNISEHRFEIAEGQPGIIGILGCDLGETLCPGNEDREAPEVSFGRFMIGFARMSGDKTEHTTVDIRHACSQKLLPDMPGYDLDVVLQQCHIGENVMINALKHVVMWGTFAHDDLVSVVDKSVSKRDNCCGFLFNFEV